jgi:hypothetical protein
MAATSVIAPIVQKPVFCTMAPNAIATRKVAHRTCWASAATAAVVIRRF